MDILDPLTHFDEEKYLAMIRKESFEEGRQEGLEIARVITIKTLMKILNLSAEQAMTALEIPKDEQEKYLKKVL